MDDKEKDTGETGIGSNASTLGGAVAGAVAGSALGVRRRRALARLPKRRLQRRRLQSQVRRHEGHRLDAGLPKRPDESRHGSG
jgi:LPXTG-motif cell wall-anchored protein